jgi:hypothetical protein
VALLSGLVLVCAARYFLERFLPAPRSDEDDLRGFATRVTVGGAKGAVRVGLVVIAVLAVGTGIVLAGTPARGPAAVDTDAILARVPHQVDPATFPAITVEEDVTSWNSEITPSGAQAILLTLAENLELENQALLQGDESVLLAVNHGDRLVEMQGRLAEATSSGRTTVEHYAFDDVNVTLIVPFGVQSGLSLGFDATGTVTSETFDSGGALLDRTTAPFEQTFVMRQATGGRWMNVAVLAAPPSADPAE